MKNVPTARGVAIVVLSRVFRDSAYAASVLHHELERCVQLGQKDRDLATMLVYGTLRTEGFLRTELGKCTARGRLSVKVGTLIPLLVSAYEICFLSKVPAFASVNEAVGYLKEHRSAEEARFGNAVLRKLAAQKEGVIPDQAAAAIASTPPWIRQALARAMGEKPTRALLAGEPPPMGLRVVQPEERDLWVQKLRAARPEADVVAGRVSPRAIAIRKAGRVEDLPGARERAWVVQEEGAQVVAEALCAKPGETVLDACAGRGNKTALLLSQVGSAGAVDAVDLYPDKLRENQAHCGALGLSPRSVYAVDLALGVGEIPEGYDAALLDAPCTGLGTILRRPELLRHRKEEDVARLSALQAVLLRRVASRVRVGGRLVYAVCSVLREEGEGVVEPFLRERTEFSRAPLALFHGEPMGRLLPDVHGTDGYFLASLVREA